MLRSGMRLMTLASIFLLLAGCTGGKRLSASMSDINREYGTLQDQALLLNIVLRSLSLPAHFTTLATIRGRSRLYAGANLNLPFGGDATSSFGFNPHMSIEQGPTFEVSTQGNQEFYRGYVAPVDTRTLDFYLRQDRTTQLVLSLFLEQVVISGANGNQVFRNDPENLEQFDLFQKLLKRLIEQGLTTESVTLVRDYGPELRLKKPPTLDQILAVRKEKMTIEKVGENRYQLRQIAQSARFCFAAPHEALFKQAQCAGAAAPRRYEVTDPTFFGSTGTAQVTFRTPELGTIRLDTRSLAEILDYLGDLIGVQQALGRPLDIPGATGAKPLMVVWRDPLLTQDAAVRTTFADTDYAIPLGEAAGFSGEVLSIITQLLAQVQSVKDLPVSNTITIIGD